MNESENCVNCKHIRKLNYDCRGTGEYKTGWCCVMLAKLVVEIKSPESDFCECFEREIEHDERRLHKTTSN